MSHRSARPVGIVTSVLVGLAAPAVRAGGFETEYPDNGGRALGRAGAFTARADDPSAIYYNPAGLSRLDDAHLYVSANVLSLTHTFEPAARTATRGSRRIVVEFDTVEQSEPLFVAPFLAGHFDLEALPSLDFAVGVYGPAANGHRKYDDQFRPVGATSGGSRDERDTLAAARADTLVPNGLIVESELTQIFPTAAVSWRIQPDLSVGVSLQNSMVFAKLRQGSGGSFPGQAELEVMDLLSPTAIVGVHWRALERLEFGFAARPPVSVEASGKAKLRRYAECQQPGANGCEGSPEAEFGGAWPLRGELPLVETNGTTPEDGVTMRFSNPAWVRVGARWVESAWDLELDYIFEGSSTHAEYAIDFDAPIVNLPAENGAGTLIPMPDLKDRRAYVNTHAVRLGGDYVVVPDRLSVRAGTAYETGASPQAYTHLDFPGMDQVTGAAGVGVHFETVDLDLGASYTHFLERTVTDSDVRLTDVQRGRAEWDVVGNGTFAGHYLVFGLSSTWRL